MEHYPKIRSVEPQQGKRLLVTFDNGVTKVYDCTPLLEEDSFKPLQNEALFNSVEPDQNGYGVVWRDDLDLSESELWINGAEVA